jgi:K+-dependent Na+/Ca+ exchanger-like protein
MGSSTQGPLVAASSGIILRRRVIFGILAVCFQMTKVIWAQDTSTDNIHDSEKLKNCTEPAILEFPKDFLSEEVRNNGGIIIHVILATYLIFGLGAICDDFFVPVLEIISDKFQLSNDVAGATFMAAGTSAPELFTNIMGTFVTKSDLGIGTIVGSAVFNIFGVISVCGIFSGKKIPLDWYPITRDCFLYGITVILLLVVLIDERVFWWESLILVVCYTGYIIIMTLNRRIDKWAHSVMRSIKKRVYPSTNQNAESGGAGNPNESTPLHTISKNTQATIENASPTLSTATQNLNHEDSTLQCSIDANTNNPRNTTMTTANQNGHIMDGADIDDDDNEDDDGDPGYPWQYPKGICAKIWWLCFLPLNLLFFITIPDVRRPNLVNFFPLSFLMSVAWIGAISYEVTWLITVIGYTISVPDTVMGLSFLAVGTSIPEVFSSLIVSKQGKGSMAVSNSIGSNTFDILICLGVPWFIRALFTGFHNEIWYIHVQSDALAYTVVSLLISLIVLYCILVASRFVLSKTLGIICLAIYAVFLTISLLFELNVFYQVNLPTCIVDTNLDKYYN